MSALDEFDALAGTPAQQPVKAQTNSLPGFADGVNDLSTHIKGIQSTIPDLVPGSPTHKRAIADLSEAQQELARYQGGKQQTAPIAPAAAPKPTGSLAEFDALSSAPSSVSPQAKTAAPNPQSAPTKNYSQSTVGKDGSMQSPGFDVVANQLSSLGSTVAGGFRGLYNTGSALLHGKSLDDAVSQGADAVTKTQNDYTFQPRTELGQGVTDALGSKWNPLNWSAKAGEYVGGKLADAGMPGTGAVVNAALTAAPMALGIKGVRSGVASAAGGVADALKPSVEPIPIANRVDPTMSKPRLKLNTDGTTTPIPEPTQSAQPLSPNQPIAAKSVPLSADTATEDMPKGQSLSQSAQDSRAQTLASVGFTDARTAALEGNNRQRASEYQMTKYDEPAGQAAAKQFQIEKETLENHVKGMVEDAGGTVGTDQGSLYQRGSTIVKPVQALRDWFDDKASGLYTAADEKAQGQPVSLGGFGQALADRSNITQPSHVLIRDAATSFAKKTGMTVGEDGAFSGTALQAETVRKWLNNTAKNDPTGAAHGYVDALKGAMDDDVAKSAGGQVYEQARSLWKLRQDTIADPKGISSLLQEDGTNRKIPLDQVANKVAGMDQDQFGHIVKTLNDVPPEIKPLADKALGEIKAHYYNQMLEASTETRGGNGRAFWNGTGVKNVIKANSGKLNILMSSEELGKIDTLRKAGDILSFDPGYPGASAQGANAVKNGFMAGSIRKIAAAGGAIAGSALGPLGTAGGAAAGDSVGASVGASIGEKSALRRFQKNSVPLDPVPLNRVMGGSP